MNAKDCILQRRSVRRFLDQPVERETVREIVDLARFAPSWKNTQIVHYNFVDDAALKNHIAANCVRGYAFNTKNLERAAAVMVLSFETGHSGRNNDGTLQSEDAEKWEMFDCGVAAQTFCLAARIHEVGTCIIGVIDEDAIHDLLHLPENQKVGCLIAMGYPEEWKNAPKRRETDDILSFC